MIADNKVEELRERKIMSVHIVNAEELTQRVEEVISEHLVAITFPVPVLGIQQILELDPLREEAEISLVGTGNVIFCHSLTQATTSAKGATVDGFLVTPPTTFRLRGSAALWVVGVSGSAAQVAALQTRRQK